MITNKILSNEFSLNTKPKVFSLLIPIKYENVTNNYNGIDEQNNQIVEQITLRNIKLNDTEKMKQYDYIFNNCKDIDIDYKENLENKYNRIIYKKIEPSEPEEEDIDSLIKNIKIEIISINNKIKKKHSDTLCIESFLGKTTFQGEDADLLRQCDDIFRVFLNNNKTRDL
jgi:hypothetical protein